MKWYTALGPMEPIKSKSENSPPPVRPAAVATPVSDNAYSAIGRRLRAALGMHSVIAVFSLALIGLTWSAVIVHLQNERQDTITEAIQDNSNLVKAFEEHTIRTIKSADAVTFFLSYQYAQPGAKMDIAKIIGNGVIDNKLYAVASIFNERGAVVVSSG